MSKKPSKTPQGKGLVSARDRARRAATAGNSARAQTLAANVQQARSGGQAAANTAASAAANSTTAHTSGGQAAANASDPVAANSTTATPTNPNGSVAITDNATPTHTAASSSNQPQPQVQTRRVVLRKKPYFTIDTSRPIDWEKLNEIIANYLRLLQDPKCWGENIPADYDEDASTDCGNGPASNGLSRPTPIASVPQQSSSQQDHRTRVADWIDSRLLSAMAGIQVNGQSDANESGVNSNITSHSSSSQPSSSNPHNHIVPHLSPAPSAAETFPQIPPTHTTSPLKEQPPDTLPPPQVAHTFTDEDLTMSSPHNPSDSSTSTNHFAQFSQLYAQSAQFHAQPVQFYTQPSAPHLLIAVTQTNQGHSNPVTSQFTSIDPFQWAQTQDDAMEISSPPPSVNHFVIPSIDESMDTDEDMGTLQPHTASSFSPSTTNSFWGFFGANSSSTSRQNFCSSPQQTPVDQAYLQQQQQQQQSQGQQYLAPTQAPFGTCPSSYGISALGNHNGMGSPFDSLNQIFAATNEAAQQQSYQYQSALQLQLQPASHEEWSPFAHAAVPILSADLLGVPTVRRNSAPALPQSSPSAPVNNFFNIPIFSITPPSDEGNPQQRTATVPSLLSRLSPPEQPAAAQSSLLSRLSPSEPLVPEYTLLSQLSSPEPSTTGPSLWSQLSLQKDHFTPASFASSPTFIYYADRSAAPMQTQNVFLSSPAAPVDLPSSNVFATPDASGQEFSWWDEVLFMTESESTAGPSRSTPVQVTEEPSDILPTPQLRANGSTTIQRGSEEDLWKRVENERRRMGAKRSKTKRGTLKCQQHHDQENENPESSHRIEKQKTAPQDDDNRNRILQPSRHSNKHHRGSSRGLLYGFATKDISGASLPAPEVPGSRVGGHIATRSSRTVSRGRYLRRLPKPSCLTNLRCMLDNLRVW
ncbi:hypothetical protein BDQ12DRAFT_739458 [Crucibulum laeve]|uniref:Uncharacterized protein n=1 Tax=Crucibulum laeve TaxID=68775 RepID=A0A5C3LUB9_9AGAR|nr:hypothetical protein BDQ12DRAFT_739458 [Crucibulum laeve]